MGKEKQNISREEQIEAILEIIYPSNEEIENLKSREFTINPTPNEQLVIDKVNKSIKATRDDNKNILENIDDVDLECYYSIVLGHATDSDKKAMIQAFLDADKIMVENLANRFSEIKTSEESSKKSEELETSSIQDENENLRESTTTIYEEIGPDDETEDNFLITDETPSPIPLGSGNDSDDDKISDLVLESYFGNDEVLDLTLSDIESVSSDDENNEAPKENVFRAFFRRYNNTPELSDEEKKKEKRRVNAERIKRKRAKRNKKFNIVKRINDDDFSHLTEKERLAETIQYATFYPKFDDDITDDIHSERSFVLELVKPLLISRKYLKRYFKTVIESYAKYNNDVVEAGYNENPNKWFDSKSNRARLVMFEATDTNLEAISKRIIKASSLERILVVGLDNHKQEAFKEHLVAAWKDKILAQEKPLRYLGKVLKCLIKNSAFDEKTSLKNFDLESLTGPHTFINDKNISYESLTENIGHSFSSKLDEINLHGDSNDLVNQIPELAHKAKVQQYLPIKSSPITDGDSPVWVASFNEQVTNPHELLTSSKDSRDILQESIEGENENIRGKNIFGKIWEFIWPSFDTEIIESKEKNYTINPRFERMFQDPDLDEHDKKYLKGIFSQYSLYPPNLSKSLYSSTITKTQSGINGEGAVVVGNALIEGIFGRQVATAKGVLFAVNSTMFDTANDSNKEEQDKMLSYKDTFEKLFIHYTTNKDMNAEEVYEAAAKGMIDIYKSIEKREVITKNERDGKNARTYTLENANKTNIKNRIGINLLLLLPIGFFFGAITAPLGIGLAALGVATSIALPIIGGGMFATMTSFLSSSLIIQRDANADKLARWHRSSARAHAFFRVANDKREHYQSEILEQLKQNKSDSLDTLIEKQNNRENSSSESQEDALNDLAVKNAYEEILEERKPNLERKKKIYKDIVSDGGRYKVHEPEEEKEEISLRDYSDPDPINPINNLATAPNKPQIKTPKTERKIEARGKTIII